jgi:hypothetical protein
MSSLSAYRKASSEKLQQALNASQTKFKKDERYWEASKDKAGNGFAIIRFLDRPIVDGEDATAFVQYFTHQFQGPGGWYIENSLTSLGADVADPVGEYNSKLWQTGVEANKDIAKKQKRKLTYISNIRVIKDATKPECEGKVFLFKYGIKIFEKIQAMQTPRPDELDEDGNPKLPVNVFDLWEGANFSLKVKKQGDFPNYDDSVFSSKTTPVARTDEEIERIIQSAYSLKAELKFKTYDELKKRLDRVLAFNPSGEGAPTPSAEKAKLDSEVPDAVKQALSKAKKVETPVSAAATPASDEEDMSFFKEMAGNDEE